jgi:acetyltransferase-like isoleucine patch superfamily enzyme
MISLIYKSIRKIFQVLKKQIYTPCAKIIFTLNGVSFGRKLKVRGFLNVNVTRRGSVLIGNNLSINSGNNHNIIGRQQRTIFWVEGKLMIGNNTGMSSTAIICNYEIDIGNYVTIGGNTVIYDTDFHSLNSALRKNKLKDKMSAKCGKVTIKDNAFIGAHTTILKGVTIGENTIIGSCSLVSKDIPDNEIWGGNPIKFIKSIK